METNKIESNLIDLQFEDWINSLTSEDIELRFKLPEMLGVEIDENTFNMIFSSKDVSFPIIENYIKEHAKDYYTYLSEEANRLYGCGNTKNPHDYSAALDSCYELYKNAVESFAMTCEQGEQNITIQESDEAGQEIDLEL